MPWPTPPLNKIYEALGAIADDRIEITGNAAKVYSSSRGKFYDVAYDPAACTIASNDNASYFVGYLGYPAIAFLLATGMVKYDPKLTGYLKGFAWKDINQKFKNDYDKTNAYIDAQIAQKHKLDLKEFHATLQQILTDVMSLKLEKPKVKQKPPQGY